MSREILYRGKRTDNGEWVEGHFITNEKDAIRTYIGYLFGVVDGIVQDVDIVEVIPITVCLYTGRIDKNGRKIFEGDIVRSDDNKIGQVQWFEEHSAFMIWNVTDNNVGFLYDNDFSKIEVIGIEFDNPELLDSGGASE